MADAAFCPYVGLRPFHEEDRPYFFGREREVRAVADNLFGARVTVFYGASGVGKSSVLLAGVVPELRTEPRTAVVVFRSWQLADAAEQLKRDIAAEADRVAGHALALDLALPLDELLRRAADAIDGTVLLILDQFEEFFLYFKDADAGFDAELARAITRRDVDAGFVLSLREDSLSKLDRLKKRVPSLLANTMRLTHLRVRAAERAIVEPLRIYNERRPEAAAGGKVAIEPDCVKAVLQQTAPGQLALSGGEAARDVEIAEGYVEAPYLQLVLERLWNEEIPRGSRMLRCQTLQDLGGAEKIVRTHLNEVLDLLTPEDKEACARIFDRLVTPSGAKIAVKLRDLAFYAGDLASVVPRLTKFLDQSRILARIPAPPGGTEDQDQYQIFHDVLAAGFLAWRERYLRDKAHKQAEADAAERARREYEDERRAAEQSARERELTLAKAQEVEERRLRKRFQYALVATVFMTAWAIFFGINSSMERTAADDQRQKAIALRGEAEESARQARTAERNARRAQARLEVEKIRDAYARGADRDEMLAKLTQVIEEVDPDSAEAYALRGRIRLDRAQIYLVSGTAPPGAKDGTARERIDLAIADLDKSLELAFRQPAVLAMRAEAKWAKDDLEGAIDDYDTAVSVAPGDPQLLFDRGSLRARAKDLAGALTDYTEAIMIDPRFAPAYLARAELLLNPQTQPGIAYLGPADPLLHFKNKKDAAREDFRLAAEYASDEQTRLTADKRLKELGSPAALAQAAPTVFIHVTGDQSADRRAAEAVRQVLRDSEFKVAGIQSVPGARTNGDVRFVVTEDKDQVARDERAAAAVAGAVENALAKAGFKLRMQTIALDAARFPEAKPGTIEVWLPPLRSAVPQLPFNIRQPKLNY